MGSLPARRLVPVGGEAVGLLLGRRALAAPSFLRGFKGWAFRRDLRGRSPQSLHQLYAAVPK